MSGLVGCWRLNEESSESLMHDSSINDNDGLANNTTAVVGKWGLCRHFSGNPESPLDYIFIEYDGTDLHPQTITITVWIKYNSAPDRSRICMIYANDWILRLHDDVDAFGQRYMEWIITEEATATQYSIKSDVRLSKNQWYFIVVILDSANNMSMYVDAVLQTDTTTVPNGMRQLGVGQLPQVWVGCNEGLDHFWHGEIDELRIFDRKLSEDEILNLYYYNSINIPAYPDDAFIEEINNPYGEIEEIEHPLGEIEKI